CGCGVADTDTDSDGVPDCNDGCPSDPAKTDPGICGCGVADTDTDSDGVPDCNDGCPSDPAKTDPGICGCGVADTDTDSDGVPDCNDGCPSDPAKTDPGICGCGVADTDTDSDGVPDCNDGCPSDPAKTDPGICGCGVAEGCYTQADPPPIVDELSVMQAYNNVINDDDLQEIVDNGEFKPGEFAMAANDWGYEWSGPYEPGLQAVGKDEEGASPRCYVDPDILDWINNDSFLAYAVQVEEDRLNMKILEMAERGDFLQDIDWQLQSGDIRSRDDYLMQHADAQSGRVLKDHQGNWVRVQQYVLKPDDNTVQVLGVSLRGIGDHAGISTIDFTTRFTESYSGDVRDLPWSDWLNTQTGGYRYVDNPSWAPELDTMYVQFVNSGDESLKEQRWFSLRNGLFQKIASEQLVLNPQAESVTTYVFNSSPGPGEYMSGPLAGSGTNPAGFEYIFGDGRDPVKIEFFVVGDADTIGNQGVSSEDYSSESIEDIWDALRTNGDVQSPDIGHNNLEIVIDSAQSSFAQSIDVIYIPMSRMLWK
ncbi:MAG: hypothetical protein SVW57_01795, partial [Thermodesulfobacteriota bacterium]|nr:hypothetical protein [Thermodesulfobacteriota bacterium]